MVEVRVSGDVAVGEEAARAMAAEEGLQAQIDALSVSGGRYEHDQGVAASVWVINHNLGAYPNAVIATDSTGRQIWGSVQHIDPDTTHLGFDPPLIGKAYLGT